MIITNKLIEAKNLLTPETWRTGIKAFQPGYYCAGTAIAKVANLDVPLEDTLREFFISVNGCRGNFIPLWNDERTLEQVLEGFDAAINYAGILGI
jgi:hypothetical protein